MKILEDAKKIHRITQRMTPHWERRGHFLVKKNADIQFCIVKRWHMTDLPWVLRLDNVIYDPEMLVMNWASNQSHKQADGVIYQGEYSKTICEAVLEPRKNTSLHKIIYNGCEPDWCGHHVNRKIRFSTPKFQIVVISRWRRHKRLYEILQVFKEVKKFLHENVILNIIGGFKPDNDQRYNETMKIITDDPQIINHGRIVDPGRLAQIFRSSDLMIHISKRDACPNTVVEAINARIPVVTTNACGGCTEMIRMGDIGHIVEGDSARMPELVDPYSEEWNELPAVVKGRLVQAILAEYDREEIIEIPEQLTIEYCAREYIKFFEEVRSMK